MPKYMVELPTGRFQVEADNEQDLAGAVAQLEGVGPQRAAQGASQASVPTKSSLMDEIKHQLGLTGRWAAKGVTGIPEIIGNAANAAVNLGVRGVNSVAGTNIPQLPTVSSGVDRALDAVGFPQPRDRMEQGLGVVATAMGGAGAANAAQSLTRGVQAVAPTIAQQVMQELSRGPVLQAIGAGSGYLANEYARDSGITNPYGLALIGMAGSTIGGTAGSMGARTVGGAAQLAAPFRSASGPGSGSSYSREGIVGQTLRRFSTTPDVTPGVIDAAQPIVPGSNPTLAQVSRDPGLISAEVGIRNSIDTTGRISQRLSEQNTARQAALDNIVMPSRPVPPEGNPQRGTLEYAIAKRDRAATQDRATAFANGGRADPTPATAAIDRILATPAGARKPVQDAMEFARARLTQEGVDLADPETLYSIRQDLMDARDGKFNSEKPGLQLAGSQLRQVMASLDNVIDTAAPGYRRYMELYAARSRPLNQREALNNLREAGQVAGSDPVSGERILTLGKFGTAARKAIASGALGRGAGNANLSDSQLRQIQNIVADLDRGAATTASTVKPPGSDTLRNLSVASVIGRMLGDGVPDTGAGRTIQTIAKPLSWLYSLPDEAMSQMLVDAVLDPRLGAQFMRTANRENIQNIASELAERAARQAQGMSIYGANQNTAP